MGSPPRPGGGLTRTLGRYGFICEITRSYLGPLWAARPESGEGQGLAAYVRRIATGELQQDEIDGLCEAAWWAMDVDHPRIAKIVDVVVGESELGIVSDYFEGEPLRALMRQAGLKRIPAGQPRALRIAKDLLLALERVHAKSVELGPEEGYVFGGLGPDNVLIGTDGETRLLDVGTSAVASALPKLAGHADRASYLAPEMFDAAQRADARSDVFALGVMLWEMLANRRLFVGASYDGVAKKVQSSPIQRLDRIRAAGGEPVAKEIADLVERALDRDPSARFDSVGEMLAAVDQSGAQLASVGETADLVNKLAGYSLGPRRKAIEKVASTEDAPLSSRFRSRRPTADQREGVQKPPPVPAPTYDTAEPPTVPKRAGGSPPAPPAKPAAKATMLGLAPIAPPPPAAAAEKEIAPKKTMLGMPSPTGASTSFPSDEAATLPSVRDLPVASVEPPSEPPPPSDEEAVPVSVEPISLIEIGPDSDEVATLKKPPKAPSAASKPEGDVPVPPAFLPNEPGTVPSGRGQHASQPEVDAWVKALTTPVEDDAQAPAQEKPPIQHEEAHALAQPPVPAAAPPPRPSHEIAAPPPRPSHEVAATSQAAPGSERPAGLPERTRKLRWVVGGVVALLAGLMVVAAILGRSNEKPTDSSTGAVPSAPSAIASPPPPASTRQPLAARSTTAARDDAGKPAADAARSDAVAAEGGRREADSAVEAAPASKVATPRKRRPARSRPARRRRRRYTPDDI